MGGVDATATLSALVGLLQVYRSGRILDPGAERDAIDRHVAPLTAAWDSKFPGFPRQYFPYTSFRGEWYRGKRDVHLKDVIVRLLSGRGPGLIVNHACVFGRHGRHVAKRLPDFRVIGADIDWRWNWWYEQFNRGRSPANFEFRQDDVFASHLEEQPTAVVFFGACGAVTDGVMDYGIDAGARYLAFRTCCHDIIAGNTRVAPRRSFLNWFFRFKNRILERMRSREAYRGFYFSDRYAPDAYPRSRAARKASAAREFVEVAGHTPESDTCRAIIDLDRHLYLQERGFDVWYQGELFVAERGTCR